MNFCTGHPVRFFAVSALALMPFFAVAQRWVGEPPDGNAIFKSEDDLMQTFAKNKCDVQISPGGWDSCVVDRTWFEPNLRPDGTKYGEAYITSCFRGICMQFNFGITFQYLTIIERFLTESDSPGACSEFGNPISPRTGAKRNTVELGNFLNLPLVLTYSSRANIIGESDSPLNGTTTSNAFGALWASNLHSRIHAQSGRIKKGLIADRGDTRQLSFVSNTSGEYQSTSMTRDRIIADSEKFLYFSANAGQIENYSGNGILQSIHKIDGKSIKLKYENIAQNSYSPSELSDDFGRTSKFNYQAANTEFNAGAISSIQDSAGNLTKFTYSPQGKLFAIQWPDGNFKSFNYGGAESFGALTQVTDENGIALSSYEYDTQGYAIGTQLAGGVNHYAASWSNPPQWISSETYVPESLIVFRDYMWTTPQGTQVSLPNGNTLSLEFKNIQGSPHLTAQSQPAGSGCQASTKSLQYDEVGNIAAKVNFNGDKTCHSYDLNRRLETSKVIGLNAEANCASFAATSPIPVSASKYSSQWHPEWPLQTKGAGPLKINYWIYNGQPDPFNGGTSACAPSSALLPDGKPIVVLCKKVEQATTDANGGQGFAATLQSGVPQRVWQYSYNEFGQVLTATDPLGNVTRNSYYSDTSSSHTKGDLQSVTNPLGQVTQFPVYNPNGQVLQMVDPNGVATDYQYDLRQRLTSVATAGATTRYDYWPTGLLKLATQPDASTVSYTYDDAHRLIAVSDSLGNRIDYTLDNSGNRTAEQVKDPNGRLARQVSRSFDALGRMQQQTTGATP